MIVLSLTEEDRALLLPLAPEQRDQVFLALLTGAGAGSNWGKLEEETLEAIRRRERRRKSKSEYSKRFGKDFDALYSERISALDPDCYIDSPDRFSLTEEGFLKLDRIILEMAMAL